MTLTDEQIAEIRARVEAATPGSWLLYGVPLKRPDLHFIAHARDDIPALLSALEAVNKRADEVETLVRMLEDAETVEIMQTLRERVAELEIALSELINHTHNCEKELTEELHHQDFCGESLPLTNARSALKGASLLSEKE